MPIYEYQCDDCGHRSEAIQRLADERLTTCDECGGTLRRLISAPAVQFKGTGWYVTDYAGRKGAKEGAPSDDSSTSAAKEASDKKGSSETSDSKPASGSAKKAAGSSPSE